MHGRPDFCVRRGYGEATIGVLRDYGAEEKP
jgi:hypothetical protein